MLDWQQFICGLPMGDPTQEQISSLLKLAKALLGNADELIQEETSQWVSEFRETLTEVERSAQNQGK